MRPFLAAFYFARHRVILFPNGQNVQKPLSLMKTSFVLCLCVLLAVAAVGCSKKPQGGPRFKTYPVTGTVTVDGEGIPFISIECHPGPDSEIRFPVSASTKEGGEFSIGTYESGDGLPAGSYTLTFTWLVPGGVAAKDNLNGAYSDKSKSEYKFTVEEGDPTDLGVIELKTK